MTPKQMYSELAKIAGAYCESGDDFIRTANVTGAELKRAQRSILALLDKLNYRRSLSDFTMTGHREEIEIADAHEAMARLAADREARLLRETAQRRRLASIDPFGGVPIAAPGGIGETYGTAFFNSYSVPRMVVRGTFDDPPLTMPRMPDRSLPGEPMEP